MTDIAGAPLGTERSLVSSGAGQARQASVVREDDVYLCLMVNRRHRVARVIDFRAGFSSMKRRLVLEHAQVCQVDRVFTLVERDEVGAWSKMGFAREGCIPGYYKRCDAYVLGGGVAELSTDRQSGTRSAVRERRESDHETCYGAGLQLARSWPSPVPALRVAPARDLEARRALVAARRDQRAVTDFEPFSRDAERRYLSCTGHGGFSVLVGVETQPCFDNAWLEVLTVPRTDNEARLLASGMTRIGALLREQGTVSCFAIAPVSQTLLTAAFLGGNFRRTGILNRHLRSGSQRVDAFLWSRKLAQPRDA